MSSHTRRHAGQALVEMALVFVILLTVIFGGVNALQNLAVQFTISQAVRTAAHEAALMGSTGGLEDGHVYALNTAPGPVADAARNVLAGGVFTTNVTKATITATCAVSPCRRYSPITVQVQYRDGYLAPLPMMTEIVVQRSTTRSSEKDQQSDG